MFFLNQLKSVSLHPWCLGRFGPVSFSHITHTSQTSSWLRDHHQTGWWTSIKTQELQRSQICLPVSHLPSCQQLTDSWWLETFCEIDRWVEGGVGTHTNYTSKKVLRKKNLWFRFSTKYKTQAYFLQKLLLESVTSVTESWTDQPAVHEVKNQTVAKTDGQDFFFFKCRRSST